MKMNERFAKRLVSLILAAFMICAAGPVFAEGEETGPSLIDDATAEIITDGQVRYLENGPKGVKKIWCTYLDTKNMAYGWEFPYSDNFFRTGSDMFNLRLARGSLGLALSAFKSTTGLIGPQYENYLKGAGFTDLYAFGYNKPSTADSLSGVIGMKQVDDFTVIAAVTCGQGYGKEWAGNLKVGDSVRHDGFNSAAKLLEGHLDHYISVHNLSGKKKLWLTGMSRAAAVANVTAADMIERGDFDDIYAYLFGVPRTTKDPVAYRGIYNICGQYDPVTDTPFQSWGYERYGIDLYTPAQESDIKYGVHELAAVDVGDQMAVDGFRNNPEVNYQLHLFMETLDELFDSSKEYTERLQPLILEAMKRKGEKDDLTDVIRGALNELAPKNPRERNEKAVMLDYLSYVTAQHMRANQRQVEYGNWKPEEPLEANLVIEHRPVTYVKWLFSTDDAQELFSTGTESRRITITGDVDVSVFRDGKGITAINSKGRISVPQGEVETPAEEITGIFAMRNGKQTVISLPAGADHDVVITSAKDCNVIIYDILVSAKKLRPEPGRFYIGDVHAGQYKMKVEAGKSPSVPEEIGEGKDHSHFISTSFNYSPTVVMRNELDATKSSHFSLSVALRLVMIIMTGAFLLLITCLVIHRIHKNRVKKGHAPYSDWYIIVPHLIVIAISAVMTQYVTFYLYPVGKVRAICAALTVFYIFLLALRGAIRSKQPKDRFITVILLAFVGLTAVYYNKLPIDSFSIFNMIAFFIMVALLSAVAVRMFRKDKMREKEVSEIQ